VAAEAGTAVGSDILEEGMPAVVVGPAGCTVPISPDGSPFTPSRGIAFGATCFVASASLSCRMRCKCDIDGLIQSVSSATAASLIAMPAEL